MGKTPTKGLLVHLPEYQHAYLKMVSHRDNKKMVAIVRGLIEREIQKEYPATEYERRKQELQQELEVVDLMIQEADNFRGHEEWVQSELERIVPRLAEGANPDHKLADYVSSRLGLSWKDFWSVVENYKETGKVEV